jgi:hypothetical protein
MGHFGDRLGRKRVMPATATPALGLVLALAGQVWAGPAEAAAAV